MNPQEEAKSSNRIMGEKIRCIGRRIGKPRLIHYTHAHRALMIDVEGYPAVAEVVKEWRIRRSPGEESSVTKMSGGCLQITPNIVRRDEVSASE